MTESEGSDTVLRLGPSDLLLWILIIVFIWMSARRVVLGVAASASKKTP